MSARLRAVVAAVALAGAGCASSGAVPARTPLELREFQTRTFETADTRQVLQAAINTLLDDGFIITSSDAELGLLTARHEQSRKTLRGRLAAVLSYGFASPWELSVTEANVRVDSFGTGSRVRASFRLHEGGSGPRVNGARTRPLLDPEFYQAFFSRLDKSLFLLNERM